MQQLRATKVINTECGKLVDKYVDKLIRQQLNFKKVVTAMYQNPM